MKISQDINKRFCKDYNLPIKIYEEPFFTERLKRLDYVFDCLDKYDIYKKELNTYKNEQEYFEQDNLIMQNIIDDIRSKNGYQEFNNMDMNLYSIKDNYPTTSIYNSNNSGEYFISLDLKTANFQSLRYFDNSIFDNKDSWEEYISQFTNSKHKIKSKHFRQVIFGTLNPKRQITYEKWIMYKVLNFILENKIIKDNIIYFGNDEIIIRDESLNLFDFNMDLISLLKEFCSFNGISLHYESFKLIRIPNTSMYIKDIILKSEINDNENIIDFTISRQDKKERYKLKGVSDIYYPYIIRDLYKLQDSIFDNYFYYEGMLSEIKIPPKFNFDFLLEEDEFEMYR